MLSTKLTSLAQCQDSWGVVRRTIPAATNNACAIQTEYLEKRPGWATKQVVKRLIFQDHVVYEETQPFLGAYLKYSLSFDGTKFAVASMEAWDRSGNNAYVISINGQPKYHSELKIYRFDWIDNDRLAWNGFTLDDSKIETRVNNEILEGFDFEPVSLGRMHRGLVIKENGLVYGVYGNNQQTARIASEEKNFASEVFKYQIPQLTWKDSGCFVESPTGQSIPFREIIESGSYQVEVDGKLGPIFDGKPDGMSPQIFSPDLKTFAYLGIRYPRISRLVGRFVSSAIESWEIKHWWDYWRYLYLIPTVILFNPYCGIGLALVESSARTHLVKNHQPWSKGYPWIREFFLTQDQKVVAVVWDGKKYHLVIDEVEGPPFEEIVNVIEEVPGLISYLGRQNKTINRVEHQI